MAPFTESSLWNVLIWLHVLVLVPVLLVMVSVTISLPIENRDSRAIDLDTCEFGDTLQPYDEDCPNGATQVLPCNPGQLKVSECIGQDGDTSRMCVPCPQKYYQSYYNRCTRCRECSKCGVNEYIKEPCNDESDTVCESIIPPEPVPTTTPRLTTTHVTTEGSTQSSTYRSVTTTELSSLGTNCRPTHAVTYRNIGEISKFLTTLAEREEPKASYRGIDTLALTVYAVIIIIILFVIVTITLAIIWKQRKKIKDLKTYIHNSQVTEMDTFKNLYEEISPYRQQADWNESEAAGLTVMPVQVNDINAKSEANVSEFSDGEHRGLQGSGGGDSKKGERGSEAPLQTGSDNPADTDTDAEGPSSALCQADVHRDAASSIVPSPNYENLPEDRSHQRDRNTPSTSHASGESGMEDFSL